MFKKSITPILTILFILSFTGNIKAENKIKKDNKPNIILILADDLGYGDLGFTGCTDYKTPHIDKLAEGGVICTNAYSSHSFCAPTRAGIMTGRYQHRFGFQENPSQRFPEFGLPESETILPKVLKDAGYKSALVGKWHLGVMKHQHPLEKGFDEFYGFTGGGHDYFVCDPEEKNDHSYKVFMENNGRKETFENYLTDDLTQYATNFVEQNQDRPFFLYLSYNAPHTPLQAPEKYIKRVSDIQDKDRRTYAAMVTALDDGVGKVMQKLKELSLEENTLVFFMSDNGGAPFNWPDNKPFNGSKGTLLEGGIHVPYLVYWKGTLQPNTYDELVMSFDVFATATALAKVANPRHKEIDSQNLIPYLLGKKQSQPHKYLYWTQGNFQEAVRTGDFKFLQIQEKDRYLFNLKNDIGETKDIGQENQKQIKRLTKIFGSWKSELPEPKYKSTGIANQTQQEYIDNLKETKK